MRNKSVLQKVFQFKYSMIYPTVFILLLVIVAPLVYSFYISLHKYILQFGVGKWVYLKNYLNAFQDREFLI